MSHQYPIPGRRSRTRRARRPLEQAFARPAAAGAPAYPGYFEPEDAPRTRTFVTGSLLLHALGFAALLAVASVAPVIEDRVIEVQLLKETPPLLPDEPAPAPKALAQRRNLPFAPAVQAVQPQIVNPRIIAEAAPAVAAEALQMDALASSKSPVEIGTAAPIAVERVSVVNSAVRARVSSVDVDRVAGPVVRGPTRVEAPVGPSVGPRRVDGAVGTTIGTAPLSIGSGNGSSVRDGVISDRDVIGSPDGALVVSVDTAIGDGLLGGNTPGGTGTGTVTKSSCLERPEVQSYLDGVKARTYERWVLPPGIEAGRKVTLRFHLDVAGSASKVAIVSAEDNALGASAVDALRAAAPFPPMPEPARCLARVPILGTFSNPVGG